MLINTVIIEDEENSIDVLRELLSQLAPDMEVIGTAGHVDDAVALIEDRCPQLVFLDIRIGDGLGFEVLKSLQKRDFQLICITAYDSYALEAFRFSAIDYLLKPIGIAELQDALNRVRSRLAEKQQVENIGALLHNLSGNPNKRISIPTTKGYDFVELENIVWCHSNGGYTTFHLRDGSKLVSSRSLGEYETLLCEGSFCRIHNNAIINIHLIKSYVKGRGGHVIMCNQVELEVSQRRKPEFLRRLML